MKTLLIEKGIVHNGKLIEWSVFYDVLSSGVPDQKTMDRIKKRLKDTVGFTKLSIEQNNDLADTAVVLGLKPVDNDRVMKTNIFKKIDKLNNL